MSLLLKDHCFATRLLFKNIFIFLNFSIGIIEIAITRLTVTLCIRDLSTTLFLLNKSHYLLKNPQLTSQLLEASAWR